MDESLRVRITENFLPPLPFGHKFGNEFMALCQRACSQAANLQVHPEIWTGTALRSRTGWDAEAEPYQKGCHTWSHRKAEDLQHGLLASASGFKEEAGSASWLNGAMGGRLKCEGI